MFWSAVVKPIAEVVNNVIDKFAMDESEKAELKQQVTMELLRQDDSLLQASKDIIVAEAQGDSSIQRSWRPIVMLWFAFLIGMYWTGWIGSKIPDEVVIQLLEIVKIGLGGYVVGRSGEKMVKAWKGK